MIDPKERCAAHICRGSFTERCVRRGTTTDNGRLYCRQHSPWMKEARQKERDAKRKAEFLTQNKEDNRRDKLRELRGQIAEESLEIFCTGDLCFTEKLKAILQDYLDLRTVKPKGA